LELANEGASTKGRKPTSFRMKPLTTTCLVNSYNYAGFVGQAVDSALAQTLAFDEIIVVDDGSTDGSAELLARRYAEHPVVRIVSKENQGQLSCFNEGFARSRGDVVFFLDADDVYEPNYHERAMGVYRRDPSFDFVFCGHRQFGGRDRLQLDYPSDRDLGYSVLLAAYLREWIGGPTSCLSMRRSVLEKILPLPFVDAWRGRADDCLVFGASLAGARKYFLAQPLVRYRVHDKNLFCGSVPDRGAVYRRRLAINSLFKYLEQKLCYDVERFGEFHHREFCTIARPSFDQLRKYLRISLAARVAPFRRLACMAEMAAHYLKRAMRPAVGRQSTNSPAVEGPLPLPLRVFDPVNATTAAGADQTPIERRRAA
jgi:glycosyltransferase involved in cell wall biosynthesis